MNGNLFAHLLPARWRFVLVTASLLVVLLGGAYLWASSPEPPLGPPRPSLESLAADRVLAVQADNEIAIYTSWKQLRGAHLTGETPDDKLVRQTPVVVRTFNYVDRRLRRLSTSANDEDLATATYTLGVTIGAEADAWEAYADAVAAGRSNEIDQARQALATAAEETRLAIARFKSHRDVGAPIDLTQQLP